MKRKIIPVILIGLLLITAMSGSAFAIEESEVENAVTNAGKEAVAGNVFIWFLCAVSFLKISQKIDSFMSSLGINVGRTGGSMLAELMVAGRAISGTAGLVGTGVSNIFNRGHSTNKNTTHQAAGQAFTGGGNGLVGVVHRAAGNAATASATGSSKGVGGVLAGAMFANSLQKNGKFSTEVLHAVATGSYQTVGAMKGTQAAQALTSYLGYSGQSEPANGSIPKTPDSQTPSGDVITIDGGTATGAVPMSAGAVPTAAGDVPMSASAPKHIGVGTQTGHSSGVEHASIPQQPPTFRNVEIGGGRITGYETPAGGGEERQFAMYNAGQYMEPSGTYETVQTADGENWYKQYAVPTVEKTPTQVTDRGVKYDQKIIMQMPQVPKRKDKI